MGGSCGVAPESAGSGMQAGFAACTETGWSTRFGPAGGAVAPAGPPNGCGAGYAGPKAGPAAGAGTSCGPIVTWYDGGNSGPGAGCRSGGIPHDGSASSRLPASNRATMIEVGNNAIEGRLDLGEFQFCFRQLRLRFRLGKLGLVERGFLDRDNRSLALKQPLRIVVFQLGKFPLPPVPHQGWPCRSLAPPETAPPPASPPVLL
jgi:hypothetical protein